MPTWKRLQGYGDDVTGSFTGTLNSTEFPMAAMVTGADSDAVKTSLSLNNVANETRATILGGNLTGTIATSVTVDGTTMSDVKTGAALGDSANQDTTSTILGGNLTGTIDGEAVGTGKSGAASGATANQDTTAEILGGNVTGSINSVAVATVTSGASAGTDAKVVTDAAFDNSNVLKVANAHANLKNSGISISNAGVLSGAGVGGGTVTKAGIGVADADYKNSNTTKTDVDLASVIDQAITVAGGKLKFGSTAQTIDADKLGGKTLAEAKADAVDTVLGSGTPANLDTLKDISDALGDVDNLGVTLVNHIATKQQAAATGINPATTPTQDVGTVGYDSSDNPWIVVA